MTTTTRDIRDAILERIRTIVATGASDQSTGVYLHGLAACLDVLLRDERECAALRAARSQRAKPRHDPDFLQIIDPSLSTTPLSPQPATETFTVRDTTIVGGFYVRAEPDGDQ